MESREKRPERTVSFNPRAAPFHPAAPPFRPAQQGTVREQGIDSGLVSSSATAARGARGSLSTTGDSTIPVYHPIPRPGFQVSQLEDLIPRPNVPPRSWTNRVEEHTSGLGRSNTLHQASGSDSLPGPWATNREGLTIGTANSRFESGQASEADTTRAMRRQTTRSDTRSQQMLFPPDTRAHGLGVDVDLVRNALKEPITPQELEKIISDRNQARNARVNVSNSNPNDAMTPGILDTYWEERAVPPPPAFATSSTRDTGIRNPSTYLSDWQAIAQNKVPQSSSNAPLAYFAAPPQNFRVPPAQQATPKPRGNSRRHSTPSRAASGPRGRRASTRGSYYARARRSDQGPEPSVADIYPEDALPLSSMAQGSLPTRGRSISAATSVPQPEAIPQVSNPALVPTLAEVRRRSNPTAQNPSLKSTASTAQSFHTAFCSPQPRSESGSDGTDTFFSAIASISSAHDESNVNAARLIPDTRELTPGQLDGSRYGLVLGGIGHGNNWNPASVKYGTPFRVRPIDHEGWGGWEWAFKHGWGDE